MAYKDEVCSKAAIYLGDVPFADVSTATGTAPEALNTIYEQVLERLLASYPWSFALKITELEEPDEWANDGVSYSEGDYVRATETNSSEKYYRCNTDHVSSAAPAVFTDDIANWDKAFLSVDADSHRNLLYRKMYQMPSDVVKLWTVYPIHAGFKVMSDGQTVAPKRFLISNDTRITLEYVYNMTTDLPSYFTEALTYALASRVALAVTEDMGTKQLMEEEFRIALGQAKNIEAQAKQTEGVSDFPLTNVR